MRLNELFAIRSEAAVRLENLQTSCAAPWREGVRDRDPKGHDPLRGHGGKAIEPARTPCHRIDTTSKPSSKSLQFEAQQDIADQLKTYTFFNP